MTCGRVARELGRKEKPGARCPFDCPLDSCIALDGVPGWARAIASVWRACGGKGWPAPGSVGEQDAAVVFWFAEIAEMVAEKPAAEA